MNKSIDTTGEYQFIYQGIGLHCE